MGMAVGTDSSSDRGTVTMSPKADVASGREETFSTKLNTEGVGGAEVVVLEPVTENDARSDAGDIIFSEGIMATDAMVNHDVIISFGRIITKKGGYDPAAIFVNSTVFGALDDERYEKNTPTRFHFSLNRK